jgi:cyanophycin synthetase
MAVRVSRTLDAGLLAVTLVTSDPGCALTDTGGAIVDLDPAPQLDRLLPDHADLMAQAAEGFVRWLYPPGTPCRIPLVAVTGTNGKTTTSRMITRIMRSAGFLPGMASTSGIYFNEVLHQQGDFAGSGGHHILFESRTINMGVLETARGAVANSGFMFDWCDVAVCLNVTEDHIGEYGIDSLQQMTLLKRSIVARARRAVVVNADYATCRDMLPFGAGIHLYLASVESAVAVIWGLAGQPSFACVLEEDDGKEWIVMYEPGGKRCPVMPVAAIPATLDGLARFNISNAQHAICACHALGVGLDVIRQGLSSFDATFENTPGRLNIYRQLPFTVVMDYAHNPDGMEKLCACIDQMDVPGRRILLYAGTGNRTDEEVVKFACSAVGHFDHFICRSYPGLRGRQPGEIPALMNAALLQAGVTQERISLVAEAERGALQALGMARPGDVVVLCPATAEVDKMWQQIISFQPSSYPQPA